MNQCLLNYTQLFTVDTDYIVFALSVTQQLKHQIHINIAMKKICNLTARVLSQNFRKNLIIYSFWSISFHEPIKSHSSLLEKSFYLKFLQIIKQVGRPTFFMALRYADLHWNELIYFINILNGKNNMNFF